MSIHIILHGVKDVFDREVQRPAAIDFVPSAAHIPVPYLASVDIQPLMALKEKKEFLNEALENNYMLYFEHDYDKECCALEDSMKGVRAGKFFTLNDRFGE